MWFPVRCRLINMNMISIFGMRPLGNCLSPWKVINFIDSTSQQVLAIVTCTTFSVELVQTLCSSVVLEKSLSRLAFTAILEIAFSNCTIKLVAFIHLIISRFCYACYELVTASLSPINFTIYAQPSFTNVFVEVLVQIDSDLLTPITCELSTQ